ncbi:MAG: hypothetical protein ICV85_12315 [Tolypothrix sp. T3-bin4]|nr:hypothetical protein [Tolypothrix sp. Co-bin9]MBD0302919.1 hypothetical protein [Tolypothrix sp. T3-bin4]
MSEDFFLSESEELECKNIIDLLIHNSNDIDLLLWRLKYEIFADDLKKSHSFGSFNQICTNLHRDGLLIIKASTCHERAWAYEERRIITSELQIDISHVKKLSVHTLLELRLTKDLEEKRQILSMALDICRNNHVTAEDIRNASRYIYKELGEIEEKQSESGNQTISTLFGRTDYLYIDGVPDSQELSEIADSPMLPRDGETLEFTVFDGTTMPSSVAAPPSGANNQGIQFNPDSRIYVWLGLRFRSKAEIAIAYALDRVGALYLPNCLARLNNPEKSKQRANLEADFLVCYSSKWGILEVDGPHHTPKRRVEEQERERLFRLHGIKVVERYDAQKCEAQPNAVVKEFLRLL